MKHDAADSSANNDSVNNKLVAARTRLILENPFIGTLVLRLPLESVDAQWCKTIATDARKIFYNPLYVAQLDIDQTQYVLAHEALHCALSHFARRHHRDKHRWDIACDFAINPMLINQGLKPPPEILLDIGFDGMTAEEIYPSIEENCDDSPLDQHVYDHQDKASKSSTNAHTQSQTDLQGQGGRHTDVSQPPPLTTSQRNNLDTQWQQRLAAAAQIARQAGKLHGAMARMVEHYLQPQISWRNLLAQYVSSSSRDDYNYSRPSSRRGDPIIYPGLRSEIINIVVALDTSGSISDDEVREFISEIDAIKAYIRARIVFHVCDSMLAPDGPWIFEPWDELVLPENISGGGGTDFNPVFEWVDQQDMTPDLLVYFTDGLGEFPLVQPNYTVIWLVKGKVRVPWGRRIQLN